MEPGSHAVLSIRRTPDGIRCVWAPEGGFGASEERPINGADLAKAVPAGPPNAEDGLESVGRLIFSRLLPRTVRDAVFEADCTTLTLDTDLPEVPWELASDGRVTLGELHALARAGGEAPPLPGMLRVLLVANPGGDLTYSESEAQAITERLLSAAPVRTVTLFGASATRHAVLETLETRPFDVLHFSCHGTYNADEPSRSALECYDAPLTAADLAQCSPATPPLLCVLNACESGKLEGSTGLPGALRRAGVAAVVSTWWPVSNRPAAFLSASLFAGLASGLNAAEALRRARVETRRFFSADPLHTWAAYTLEGPADLRLTTQGVTVRVPPAPFVGRDQERAALDAATACAKAGRGGIAAVLGKKGAGKTRLLEEWAASLPRPPRRLDDVKRGDVLLVDDADRLDAESLGRLRVALAHHEGLIVLAAEDLSPLSLPPTATVISLGPLPHVVTSQLLRHLGVPEPGVDVSLFPGEAVAMSLASPSSEAGELVNSLPTEQRMVMRAVAVLGGVAREADLAAVTLRPRRELALPLEDLCAMSWLVEREAGLFALRSSDRGASIRHAFRPQSELHDWSRRAAHALGQRGGHAAAATVLEGVGDRRGALAELHKAFLSECRRGSPEAVVDSYRLLVKSGGAVQDRTVLLLLIAAAQELEDWTLVRDVGQRLLGDDEDEAPLAALMLATAAVRLGDLEEAQKWLGQLCDPSEIALISAEIFAARGSMREAAVLAGPLAPGSPRAATVAARALSLLGRHDEAIAAADAAMGASSDTDFSLRVLVSEIRHAAGDFDAAEVELRRLMDEAHPHQVGRVALAYADLLRDTGRLVEAERVLDEASRVAGSVKDVALLSTLSALRASVYRRDGRYALSIEEAERAGDIARSAGLVVAAAQADIHLATALLETGDVARAERLLRGALEDGERQREDFPSAWALCMLGQARLEAGDPTAAEDLLRRAEALSRSHSGIIGQSAALLHLGWASWDRGEPDRGHFDAARTQAQAVSYRAAEFPATFALSLLDDDAAGAAAALRQVEELNMGPLAAHLRWRRGEWFAARERWGEAEEDLAAVCRVARRLGMRLLQARASEALARVWDGPQPERAAELREEAVRLRAGPRRP